MCQEEVTKEGTAVVRYLVSYIDVDVLAWAIGSQMVVAKVPLTYENAKKIWLDVVENLPDVIEGAIEHL